MAKSDISKEDIFGEIKRRIESFLPPNNIDIERLSELVNIVHGLGSKDKEEFEELYKKIGRELFSAGMQLPQYNENLFVKIPKPKVNIKSQSIFDSEKDFEDKLNSLLNYCKDDLGLFSRCFLFRFGNDKSLGYSYLLLHDFHSKATMHNKINTQFHSICEMHQINEFIENIKSNPVRTSNYIVLLTLSSHINPHETIFKEFGCNWKLYRSNRTNFITTINKQ